MESKTEKLLRSFGEKYTKANEGWFYVDIEKKKKRLIKNMIKKLFLEHK